MFIQGWRMSVEGKEAMLVTHFLCDKHGPQHSFSRVTLLSKWPLQSLRYSGQPVWSHPWFFSFTPTLIYKPSSNSVSSAFKICTNMHQFSPLPPLPLQSLITSGQYNGSSTPFLVYLLPILSRVVETETTSLPFQTLQRCLVEFRLKFEVHHVACQILCNLVPRYHTNLPLNLCFVHCVQSLWPPRSPWAFQHTPTSGLSHLQR